MQQDWFSEDLSHHCDSDHEHINPIFSQAYEYDDVPSSYVLLQKAQQFWRYSRNDHILTVNMNPHCDPDTDETIDGKTILLHVHHHTEFGYKQINS